MNFFTNPFKYGSMRDEDKLIKEELFSAVESSSRYDAAVNAFYLQVVNNMVSWLEKCFTKYPPHEFHYRMSNGFDFVQDMKMNHPQQLRVIVGMAKRFSKRIKTDKDRVYTVIIKMLERKGYNPTQYERQKIYINIGQFLSMVGYD